MTDPQDHDTEPAVKKGYGVFWAPVRWKPYSPKSEQFKRGWKGRWQMMNEYSGWNNCEQPNMIVDDPDQIKIEVDQPND